VVSDRHFIARVTAACTKAICLERVMWSAGAISCCISGIAEASRRARSQLSQNLFAGIGTATVPARTGTTGRAWGFAASEAVVSIFAAWPRAPAAGRQAQASPTIPAATNSAFIGPTCDENHRAMQGIIEFRRREAQS
jgi:hypothetical protein